MVQKMNIIHYPNLRTVLQVEKVIQNADTVITKNELKRRLPAKIMHQTLNLIIAYLEASGKVYVGSKGVTWIQNESLKLKELIRKGTRVA
jgi:hypothetical protein